MEQEKVPVKPWVSQALATSINRRKAWVWYVMHLKGVNVKGVARLLGGRWSDCFISQVIEGTRKSRPLEDRMAEVFDLTWEDLWGPEAGLPGRKVVA